MTRPAVRSLLMFLQRASSSGLKHSQLPSPPLTPLAAAAAVLESPPAAAAGLDASAPSAEVLEALSRRTPGSSLYNSFRYDAANAEAPYPLWWLDPQHPQPSRRGQQ